MAIYRELRTENGNVSSRYNGLNRRTLFLVYSFNGRNIGGFERKSKRRKPLSLPINDVRTFYFAAKLNQYG